MQISTYLPISYSNPIKSIIFQTELRPYNTSILIPPLTLLLNIRSFCSFKFIKWPPPRAIYHFSCTVQTGINRDKM